MSAGPRMLVGAEDLGLGSDTLVTIAAAMFGRLGYRDVRVYEGGKTDWAAAGLPFDGSRTTTTTTTSAAAR